MVACLHSQRPGRGGSIATTLRMRRTRRTSLRLLGFLGLLTTVLLGVAAAGWLPPVNRWVERRLLAELRVLGVEAEAAPVGELSWRRAVVGPVELRLPGLVMRAEEARAELGWRVLARRAAPHVVLRGLVLEVQLDRVGALRAALQPQSGGFPYGRLDVEHSRLVLLRGDQRRELPFSGYFDSMVEEFRCEVAVAAPTCSGLVTVRGDLAEGSVELILRDGRVLPADWQPLLAGLAPERLAAASFDPAAELRGSGSAKLRDGRWSAVALAADLPPFRWQDGPDTFEVGAAKLTAGLAERDGWRCEVRAGQVVWTAGDRKARIATPVLSLEPHSARLAFAEGHAEVAGARLAGGGQVTARLGGGDVPVTAEAVLQLASVEVAGWRLRAPTEVRGGWNGAELTLAASTIDLAGPAPLQLVEVEAALGGVRDGPLQLMLRAQAAVDAVLCLEELGVAGRVEPATVAARVVVNAMLERGSEGARAELSIPAQRRTIVWPDGRVEAVIGGDLLVNLDRNFLSGRASVDFRDIAARSGRWSVMAPGASLSVRWPRIWLEAVAGWATAPVDRLGREVLWVGDYEGKLSNAAVRHGEAWRANGVGVRLNSRGAELHETGGFDLTLTATELATPAGGRLAECRAEVVAGLEGALIRAGCAIPEFGVRPTIEQTVRWSAGFETEGTFGFDPVVLSGKEPWPRRWPQLRGWEFSGGVGVSGRNRYAAGEWTLGADLLLNDFSARSAQGFTVDGIRGRVAVLGPQPWRTAPAQTLSYRNAGLGAVNLAEGSVTFSGEWPGRLGVEQWGTNGLGGRLDGTPFALDPRNPEFGTQVSLKAVKLEELLGLFDDVPATAEGLVDGSLPLRWSGGRLRLGTGQFRLSPGEMGRVQFTRDLQLLTSGRQPGTPTFASLRKVEQSIQLLLFNRLQIDTYPQDAPGQSLRVRLQGVPAGGEFTVPVSIDVNVNAPLEHFLNWGVAGWNTPPPASGAPRTP